MKYSTFARLGMRYGFVIIVVAVFAFFSIATNNFFTLRNVISMLHSAAPTIIFSAGAAMVIMMGKVDLSIGSTMFLSSAIGVTLINRLDWHPVPAIGVALLVAITIGVVNAALIVKLRITPMIATMGTMISLRGLAMEVCGGSTISIGESMRQLGSLRIGPVYVDVLFSLLVLFLVHILHRRTSYGRYVTAIGNEERIAVRLGVPVNRVVLYTFVLASFLAAVSGLLLAVQVGGVATTFGQGKEFTAIAVAVIGGISMFGGVGRIFSGLMLGVATLTIIEAGLNFSGASPYAYRFVQGGIIFVAMYAQAYQEKLGTERGRAAAAA